MNEAPQHNVQFEAMLAVIGWRSVNLSWRAFSMVAPMIPTVTGVLADLEEL
ncbi:MAG: hypothetical protein J7530_08190 [Novosphingobium sp.]|nr:hypothetical protein [Novosphingobium sp.]